MVGLSHKPASDGPTPLAEAVAEASALAGEERGRYERWQALFWGALALALARDADGAGDRYRAFVAFASEFGGSDPAFGAFVTGHMALARGDIESAVRALATTHESVTAGNRATSGWTGAPLARALLELGHDAQASAVVEGFAADAWSASDRIRVATLRAALAARAGDAESAARLSREAADIAEGTDLLPDRAYVALDRAEALLAAGRDDDARDAAQAALEMFERKGLAAGVRHSRAFLARLGTSSPTAG